VYKLSGVRYERGGGQGIVHAAYVFEVGPEVVADFLRAFGNKAKLVLKGHQRSLSMLMEFIQNFYGLRPDSGASMVIYVDFIRGGIIPLRIRFYRELSEDLGRAVGRTEALVKFGDYSVLAVVDGVKYVGFDATMDGFRWLEVAEKYLKYLYPLQLEYVGIDRSVFIEEVEDTRRLAEEALQMQELRSG